MITKNEVMTAMRSLGYNPIDRYVDAVIKKTNQYIPDRGMAAMFVAQLAHESGGFQHIEEKNHIGPGRCERLREYDYGKATCYPGKCYHGRGFIQLSWPDNYRAAGASQYVGKGDQLWRDPDQVARDPELGAAVSVWFWKANVEPKMGNGQMFGLTTRAINGVVECNGQHEDQSRHRYACYLKLAEVMRIDAVSECGCYN